MPGIPEGASDGGCAVALGVRLGLAWEVGGAAEFHNQHPVALGACWLGFTQGWGAGRELPKALRERKDTTGLPPSHPIKWGVRIGQT